MMDEFLVAIFKDEENASIEHRVLSYPELFKFLQDELSKETGRKLFTVKKIGQILLDLS
jgi:hypothetical protein